MSTTVELSAVAPEDFDDFLRGPDALDYYFGLSYASWLVLPRAFMDAMPEDWRIKMADLLHEWDETWNWPDELGRTHVHQRINGRIAAFPEWLVNYRRPDREAIESMRAKP
jgi:hypothetical protein